jgi:predicted aspartyl protease
VKYTYCQDYQPAFPALEIVLLNDDESLRSGPISALVDTGSDGTLVPISYLKDLQVVPLRDVTIRSHWGERRSVQLFVVDLEIAGSRLPGAFVVGDEQGNEIVLGRNLLNKLVLLMDGPAETVALR